MRRGYKMKNLKRLREEKGVSQQKVANAIGSTQQSVHRYEKGDYEPDIHTMILLASYFNTSIDYLAGNTEIRRKIEAVEKYELNREESELIDKYRELSPQYRQSLIIVLDTLLNNRQT